VLSILVHLFELFQQFRIIVLAQLILQIFDLFFQFGDLIVESLFLIFVFSLLVLPIFFDLAILCLKLINNVLPLRSLSLKISLCPSQILFQIFRLFLPLGCHFPSKLRYLCILQMLFFKQFCFVVFQLIAQSFQGFDILFFSGLDEFL